MGNPSALDRRTAPAEGEQCIVSISQAYIPLALTRRRLPAKVHYGTEGGHYFSLVGQVA